ncbi:MAG: methyltransferase [Cyanobacteria bacterium P01_A01_bin.40]
MDNIEGRLALIELIYGYYITQCIKVAAQLKISDFLDGRAKSYQELARESQSNPDAIWRMLRLLKRVGIFEEIEEGVFQNTELSSFLKSNIEGSLRPLALCHGGTDLFWQSWRNLDYTIKTGKSASEYCLEANPFEYLSKNPEVAELFDEAMSSLSALDTTTICDRYDFSQFNKIVDVGGGRGELLMSILEQNSSLEGILFDQQHVVDKVYSILKNRGLLERCSLEAGSFFEPVPSGYDAYLLRHIIHDWNDAQALKILKNCREAMRADSKILVLEILMETEDEPLVGRFRDLNMLVSMPEGKERTEQQYSSLYKQAGLQLTQIVTLPSTMSIIEGIAC